MLNHLLTQLLRSFGIFFRTIRAFFTRKLAGLWARLKRFTNFSRQATKVAADSLQSAAAIAKKPTSRGDYVETGRLFISKKFLLTLAVGLIALGLLIVWRYSIQGLGHSSLAMLAGVAEMAARIAVALALVPALGYFGAELSNPAAWVAACLLLYPAYRWTLRQLQNDLSARRLAALHKMGLRAAPAPQKNGDACFAPWMCAILKKRPQPTRKKGA